MSPRTRKRRYTGRHWTTLVLERLETRVLPAITISSLTPSAPVSGQLVTVTGTAAGPDNVSIEEYPSGMALASGVAVANNVGSYSYNIAFRLAAGMYELQAKDTHNGDISSPPFSQTVNPDSTSVLISSTNSAADPSPSSGQIEPVNGASILGDAITFTATVRANSPGSGTPTGSVTFTDAHVEEGKTFSTTSLASVTLDGSGVAIFGTSALLEGDHTISAAYSGDSNFTGNTPGQLDQVVNPSAATVTQLSSSVSGAVVTFIATVSALPPFSSPAPGVTTGTPIFPTGTVTFTDTTTATTLGTVTLDSGHASFSTTTSDVTDIITAKYNGDGGKFQPSVADNSESSTLTLTSSREPSQYGGTVTFTATVRSGGGTPTGTVSFEDGTQTAPIPSTPGSDPIWFAPSIASPDELSLFQNLNAEKQPDWDVNSQVSVFQLFIEQLLEPPTGQPPTFVTNSLAQLKEANLVQDVQDAGMELSFETGGQMYSPLLEPGQVTDTENAITNVAGADGSVQYVAMGEPYGSGFPALLQTGMSADDADSEIEQSVANYINDVKQKSPSVEVGDTEPYPSLSASQIMSYVTGVIKDGATPKFFHLDIDWASNPNLNTDLPILRDYFAKNNPAHENIPFGVIFDGVPTTDEPITSDQQYSTDALGNLDAVKSAMGVPQQAVFESFAHDQFGNQVLPTNLPEAQPYTSTWLLNQGIQDLESQSQNLATGVSLSLTHSGTLTFDRATFSTSALAVGNHTITAVYSGDPNPVKQTLNDPNDPVSFEVPKFLGSWGSDAQTVSKDTASVAIFPSQSNAPAGFAITLTAAVRAANFAIYPSDGTVTFSVDGTPLPSGPASVTSGIATATYAWPILAQGISTITATYTGDGEIDSGNSSIPYGVQGAFQLPKHYAWLTSSAGDSLVTGESTTLTLFETAVSGTVQFYDGGTPLQSVPLVPEGLYGTASLTTTPSNSAGMPTSGQYRYRADFTSGEVSNTEYFVLFVGAAPTVTTLTVAPKQNPATYNNSVTFTATVTGAGSGPPTGDVAFLDGASTLGIVALNKSGIATFATRVLPKDPYTKLTEIYTGINEYFGVLAAGTHTITAEYLGTPSFSSSPPSSPISEIISDPLNATVAGSAGTEPASYNFAVLGQPITVNLSTGNPNDPIPTGTVTLVDDESGTTLASDLTLDASGAVTVDTGTLGAGDHTITAVYNGDNSYPASSSNFQIDVLGSASPYGFLFNADNADGGATSDADVGTNAAVDVGTAVNVAGEGLLGVFINNTSTALDPIDVTVDDWGDGSTPQTGDAQVVNLTNYGSQSAGPGDELGIIGLHAYAAPGTYTVSGQFTDALTGGLIGDWTTQVFVSQGPTTTAVSSSEAPAFYGDTLTLTASVGSVAGATAPTGTVTFYDGTTVLGTGTLDGTEEATFTTSALSTGTHSIAAVYQGDLDFTGSSGTWQQLVISNTTVGVAVSTSQPVYGQALTFTATVSGADPQATPTGTVDFMDADIVLESSVTLDSSGTATFSTPVLSPGDHAITVAYDGDNLYAASSDQLTETVSTAPTVTTVSSSIDPSSGDVTLTATVNAASNPDTGPTGVVTFMQGSTVLDTDLLDDSAQATFSSSSLDLGQQTIIAVYSGDMNFQGSIGDDSAEPPSADPNFRAVTVSTSLNPAVFGQPVTFTATVLAAASDSGPPTGTVTLLENDALLASDVTLVSGQATFSTNALSTGSDVITAVYDGGDGSPLYGFGDDSAAPQVVNEAATTTTVTSAANPSVWGQVVTFTATVAAVSPGAGIPTGTVTFTEGSTTIAGDMALDGSGQATFTTSSLSVNTHTISVSYSGDGNFTDSTGDDSIAPQVVSQASSTVAVSSSADPSVWGQVVTFTATVSAASPGAGTPTGAVTFTEGSTTLAATVTLNGSAQATFTISSLSVATHTISVSYSGDGNFLSGSGDDSGSPQVVNQASTTVTVSSAPNASVWGQVVTFTAMVSAVSPGAGTPSGTLTFTEGSTTLAATVTLNGSAQATFTTSSLSVSTHTITASYSGDGTFVTSSGTDSSAAQVVNKASSSITVSSSVSPAVFGQKVTFTATVAAVSPGAGTPSGTVTFKEGSTTLAATVTLNGSGQATFSISSLSVGTHTITASYSGDGNFLTSSGSDSGSPEVVNKASSSVTVSSAPNPAVFGQKVTFTATVAAVSPGAGTPSRTVTFTEGSTTLAATVTLNGSAQATFTINSLSVATHTITASYSGDGNFLTASGSDSSAPQVVNKASSSVAVTSTANPSVYGQAVTFSATVSAVAPGTGTPTGTVTFKEGSTTLAATVGLNGSAVATFTTSSLSVSTHTITASYSGDSNFASNSGSDSASPQVVNQASTSTALTVNLAPPPGAALPVFNHPAHTYTLVATVSAVSPGAGTPTGTVTFYDNGNVIQTVTLSRNEAKILNVVLPSASTITATYSGDSNFVSSTSPNVIGSADLGNAGVAYTPAQIRSAYGVNNLTLDGTGQTIAIVDAFDNPAIYQALDAFDGQFGVTASGPTLYGQYGPASSFLSVVNQSGQTAPLPATDPAGDWELEESLDVEWAHAMAPGAHIVLVEANSQSLADLMAGVATAASQPGVSVVSMSWGFPEGTSVLAQDEATYDSYFNVPGVTFVASSGDYGTADPEYPAFSPNVVAVGGTTLNLNSDGSYQGETGWGYNTPGGGFFGSGGGVSQFEPEPAYQRGVQSTGSRTTPDVAFVADPATGAWIADPYNQGSAQPFEVVGGTSLGAPSWAGLVALVNQGRADADQPALNSSSPTETQQDLYSLGQSDYHVIASGTNGGYNAAPGYNLVTGLGTPITDRLVPDLVAGNFPATGQVAPIDPSLNANQGSGAGGQGSGGGSNAMPVFAALDGAMAQTRGDSVSFDLRRPGSALVLTSPDGIGNAQSQTLGSSGLDSREGFGGFTIPSTPLGGGASSPAEEPENGVWRSESLTTALQAANGSDLLFAGAYLTSPDENSWAEQSLVEPLTDSLDEYRRALQTVLDEWA
jgi:large repetitive protein